MCPNRFLTLISCYVIRFLLVSRYPANRSKKDDKGADVGIMGNVELVQNATLSTQPINSVDWSPDKVYITII